MVSDGPPTPTLHTLGSHKPSLGGAPEDRAGQPTSRGQSTGKHNTNTHIPSNRQAGGVDYRTRSSGEQYVGDTRGSSVPAKGIVPSDAPRANLRSGP